MAYNFFTNNLLVKDMDNLWASAFKSIGNLLSPKKQVFNVGEGLNPQQAQVAQQIVRTPVSPEAKLPPSQYSLRGSLQTLNPKVQATNPEVKKELLGLAEKGAYSFGFAAPETIGSKMVPELERLLQEARKYKSAEEFVNSKILYRGEGGTKLPDAAANNYYGKGVYLSSAEETATQYGKVGTYKLNANNIIDSNKTIPLSDLKKVVSEIDKTTNTKAGSNILQGGIDYYEGKLPKNWGMSYEALKRDLLYGGEFRGTVTEGTEAINNGIKKLGYEGISYTDTTGLKGTNYVIFDGTKVEKATKSQLTSIWEQANKPMSVAPQDSVQKIMQAIKEAKPVRGTQEKLYSAERGQRMAKAMSVAEKTSGETGFYKELGQLKGELPKAEFESIRNKVNQEDIDNLFNQIKDNPAIGFWDKIQARSGLAKLFGQYGGAVPTEGELKLLTQIFPKEFVDTILEKRTLFQKIAETATQLFNIPRSVMASFDLSAPFRQGLFLMNKPAFRQGFGPMIKEFGSEKFYEATQKAIVNDPVYGLAKEAGLSITDVGKFLVDREEKFMSSWAEKIPLVGSPIRASGRAYVGFLNKLRFDTFKQLLEGAKAVGRDPATEPDLAKNIAKYINTFSGRGNIESMQRSVQFLNGIFFSPRLAMSRLQILNPINYVRADPFVRKEMLKSVATVVAAGLTAIGLAKTMGAKVGDEPTSSDFGKIIAGNTRIDIWGGTQQYIRMFAQLLTGKYTSSTTGKTMTLGEGYKPLTRFDILLRQIESKEAPVFSFITDLLKQQNYKGEPVKITDEVVARFVPMVIGDFADLIKDNPNLFPLGFFSLFGVGLQTYEKAKSKSSGYSF